jgi:hypothetical protein
MYQIVFAGTETVHLEVYLGTLDSTDAWVLNVQFERDGDRHTASGLWLGFSTVKAGSVPVMMLDVGEDLPLSIRLDHVRQLSL